MIKKIILLSGLIFTSSVFAEGFFIGLNGGGNVTRKTSVGDLPMAREEFDINAFDRKDNDELLRNRMNGGTLADVAHLMRTQLIYSTGWIAGIDIGYQFEHFKLLFNAGYSQMKYDDIRDVADNQSALDEDNTGETNLWTGLVMGEYVLPVFNSSALEPVVGVGAGVSRVQDVLTDEGITAKRQQIIFAYKIKAGINYNFTKQVQGSITTDFFGTGKIKATNNAIKQWQFIKLGVRWMFK